MKKIILVYGLIAGLIMGGMFFVQVPFWKNDMINFDNGMVVGYTTMVIALSLVFFGVKSYRDQHLNGTITFGKAFQVGILIKLVASVMYCLSWEVCSKMFFSDFSERWQAHTVDSMKSAGASQAEINEATDQLAQWGEWYKNPLLRFAMTMMEVFPVGLVITLLSAALLRRKEVLPVTE
jgi:ethanolamine transporter EutH